MFSLSTCGDPCSGKLRLRAEDMELMVWIVAAAFVGKLFWSASGLLSPAFLVLLAILFVAGAAFFVLYKQRS